jgi:8-oxo-dGTP pyrophosphatase MutT (NUDIX family)
VISTQTITQQLAQHQPVLSNTGDSHAAVALILDSAAPTGDPEIVFIERARVLSDPWSGHIAFPGGRCEPDDQLPQDTAVRETEEEIGIDLSAARLLGRLDDLTGRRSHHLVVSCFVIEPMPFISLRAAYRYHLTDYTDSVTGHDRREVTNGFRFGGGIHW